MKRISFLLGLLCTVMLSVSAQQQISSAITGDSYDFEGGTAGAWFGWGGQFDGIKVESPGYKSEYCMLLKPKAKSSNAWEAQAAFAWAGKVDPNVEYTLRFMAKGKGKLQMFYQNGEGGNQQYKSWFEFTDDWEEYTETLKLPDDIVRVLFSFATADEVYIDNVEFGVKVDGVRIDNLLKGASYGFEGGELGAWQKGGGNPGSFTTFEAGKPGAVLSEYALNMACTSSQNWESQPYIVFDEPLEADVTYYLRYWAKGAGKIQSCFQEKDDYNSQVYGPNNDLTEDWKCFYEEVDPSVLSKAPGKYQKLLFQVGGSTNPCIDNIEFGPLYVEKPKTKELIEGDSQTFEGGFGKWAVNNGSGGTIGVTSPGYEGSNCGEFTANSGLANAWDFQPCYLFDEPLDPTKVYHFEFWAKGSGSFGICYQHKTWDNAQDSKWASYALTDEWQFYSEDYSPSDGQFQKLLINGGTFTKMYIDNVRFWTEPDPDFKIKRAGDVDAGTAQFDYVKGAPDLAMTADLSTVEALIGCSLADAELYDYDLKGDSILWEVAPQGWYNAKGVAEADLASMTHFIEFNPTTGAWNTEVKVDVIEEGAVYQATQCIANTKTGAYVCVNFTLNDIDRPIIDFTKAGEEDVIYTDVNFLIDANDPQTRTLDVAAGLEAIGCSATEAKVFTYFDPQKKWVADPVERYNGAFDRDGLSISKDAALYTHDVILDPVAGKVTFGFNQAYDFSLTKTLPAVIALVNPTTGAAYLYKFKIGAEKVKGEIDYLTLDLFHAWDSDGLVSNIDPVADELAVKDKVYRINEKAEAVAHAYGDPNFHSVNYAKLDAYGTLHTFFDAGTPVFYFNRGAGDASYLRLSQEGCAIVDANGKINNVRTKELLIQEDLLEDPYLKEVATGHWAVSLKSIRIALGGFSHLHAIEGHKDAAVNDPYISKGLVRIYKAVLTTDIADLPAKEDRKHNGELTQKQDEAYQAYADFADEDTYAAALKAYNNSVKSADFYEPYVKAITTLDAQGQAVWNSADNAEFKAMYDNGTIDETHPDAFTEAVKAAQVAQNTSGSTLYFFGSKKATDWMTDQTKANGSALKPASMYLETPVDNPYLPDAPARSANDFIKQFVNVKGQTQEFAGDKGTLYQTITGLVPNGEYKVQFYVQLVANDEFNAAGAGDDVAEIFTNTETAPFSVGTTSGAQVTPQLVEITGWANMDGEFTYGIQNFANGGNWVYAQFVDLTLVKLHSDFPDGEYYLKVADMDENEYAWFGGANSWGTQAALIGHGISVKLESVGHNICTINTHTYNNANDHFLGTNCYIDAAATPWTFTNNGDGTWSLSCEAGELCEGTVGEGGVYTNLAIVEDGGTPVKWELVSYEQRLADLTTYASPAVPKDATFIINAADFSRNNYNKSFEPAWTIEAANCNISGGNNLNNLAESWRSSNGFNVYQNSKTEIPNGLYRVWVQASVCDYSQTFEDLPVAYANDVTTPFILSSIADRQGNNENSMGEMSVSFTDGKYQLEPMWVVVTDNTLKVGVKSTRTDVWAVWDNFEIEYYGPLADPIERIDPKCEIIATAHVDIDASSTTGANETLVGHLDYADVVSCIGGDFDELWALNATEGLVLEPFQWTTFTGAYNMKGEAVDVRDDAEAYIYIDYNKSNPDHVAVRTLVDPAEVPADEDFKVHTYFIIYRAAAAPGEKGKAVLVDVQINFSDPNNSDATAIETVKAATADGQAYDLSGRKVNALTKGGLYIVNGNKVLVK